MYYLNAMIAPINLFHKNIPLLSHDSLNAYWYCITKLPANRLD